MPITQSVSFLYYLSLVPPRKRNPRVYPQIETMDFIIEDLEDAELVATVTTNRNEKINFYHKDNQFYSDKLDFIYWDKDGKEVYLLPVLPPFWRYKIDTYSHNRMSVDELLEKYKTEESIYSYEYMQIDFEEVNLKFDPNTKIDYRVYQDGGRGAAVSEIQKKFDQIKLINGALVKKSHQPFIANSPFNSLFHPSTPDPSNYDVYQSLTDIEIKNHFIRNIEVFNKSVFKIDLKTQYARELIATHKNNIKLMSQRFAEGMMEEQASFRRLLSKLDIDSLNLDWNDKNLVKYGQNYF